MLQRALQESMRTSSPQPPSVPRDGDDVDAAAIAAAISASLRQNNFTQQEEMIRQANALRAHQELAASHFDVSDALGPTSSSDADADES